MKNFKSLKVLVVLLSFSSILSCSNDETNELKETNLNSDFKRKLESFNENYQSQISQARWGFGGFFNSIVIAAADIAGAGAGALSVSEIAFGIGVCTAGTGGGVVAGTAAVVSGAGASIAAANDFSKKKPMKSYSNYIKSLNIDYTKKYSYLSNIGALHNEQVFNILNEGLDKNKFNCSDKRYIENSNFLSISRTKKWQNVISKVEKISTAYSKHKDVRILTNSLRNNSLINDNVKNVLDLFFVIYNQSKNSRNIEDIANFYIKAVSDEASLDNTEKEALISSFSVATESPYFWKNQTETDI